MADGIFKGVLDLGYKRTPVQAVGFFLAHTLFMILGPAILSTFSVDDAD